MTLDTLEARRQQARARYARRRAVQEDAYRLRFAEAILRLFPAIPMEEQEAIVARTCEVGSRRIGRNWRLPLSRKAFLAVVAHVRHSRTLYDELLDTIPQAEARKVVWDEIKEVLQGWSSHENRFSVGR